MTSPLVARIGVDALRHNFARVKEWAGGSRVMAVVKAEAYGHGLLRSAQAFDQADGLAVARIEEACALRAAGIRRPILLLEGFLSAGELAEAAALGLWSVVHHEEQLALLARARLNAPLPVWLKLDTGMHRLGFPVGQAAMLAGRLAAPGSSARLDCVMTHLACADEPDRGETRDQIARFMAATSGWPVARSVANSAALIGIPGARFDWVRPGLALYGASPFGDRTGEELGLQPVMTVATQLIAIQAVKRGEAVGYGASWRASADLAIGIAAIGYGDGYPRHAVPGTPVLVNGRRAALVGRVSMDMLAIDLSGHPEARIGDPVVVWGQGLPVEEIAHAAGTVAWELLCGVTRRVAYEEMRELSTMHSLTGS